MKITIALLLLCGSVFGATGYTASCPGSTTVNTPIICTVTLTPIPSYFHGTETITLTPSANVTLSKSGAWTNGIGPNSFSFAFTDPQVETGTITFANSQGWSNPTPVSVSVTSPAPPPSAPGKTIAFVQGVGANSNGNATTLTFNISPTSGNTLILGVSLYNTLGPPYAGPTAIDNLGHSFTLDTLVDFNYTAIYLASALLHLKVGAGVTSITVTRGDGQNSYISAIAGEYTNVADSPLDFADRSGDDTLSGCCWVSGPIATTNSTDLIIGYAYQPDSATPVPGDSVSPWSLAASTGDNFGGGTGVDSASMVYQVVSSTGAYQPAGNGHYAVGIAAGYKAAPNSGSGQALDLSTVRVQNVSFPAQSHSTPVIAELELSDWTSVTIDDVVVALNAIGLLVDYSDSTHLRIADDWATGGSASNFSIPLNLFSNNYLYLRFQHDNVGIIGPAKTDYCQAWDRFGVLQYSGTITYTGDSGYSFAGLQAAQNGNATVQRIHFLRSGTTLVPIASRSPATADIGPLNSGSWAFQWKFDGTLADASGNGWTPAMSDASTPSGTCGSTATSYCDTLYQVPIPVIATGAVTWRAGVPQTPSCANSFSQADASPAISGCFWQVLSAPVLPTWSSHNTAAPTLTGLIAGDYNLQLEVTDATPQTVTVSQHIGVVATDSNDIVINTAGLPTEAQTDVILGPLQKWESSLAPYPLFDELHGLQQALRATDFQAPLNGASGYQAGTSYFDYAQPGTVTVTQFSNIASGSGTSWLSTIGDAGDTMATTAIYTSVDAGIHASDTFPVTGSNNIIKLAFDGGSPITVTLTTGSRNAAQIATDIQSAIGGAGTAVTDSNGGLLIKIATATIGTSGSVAVQTVANNAYTLLGLTVGTFTVANNPQPNMVIIPWYLTGSLSTPNPAYPTGRRQVNVRQVLSNTSLIIQQSNGLNWRLPTQTNIQYAIDNQAWPFFYFADNNGNYYDNVLADYFKALKSGVATDLAQARARADRWFRGPKIDLGQEYTTSGDSTTTQGSGNQMVSRLLGLMGDFLRALDGESAYWTGLEYIVAVDIGKLSGPGSNIADIYTDQREFGYAVQRVSMCALFDPNAYAATCRAALVTVTANIITPSLNTVDSAFPYFPVLYYSSASYQGSSSVCVINGSASIIGTGTSFSTSIGAGTNIWFFPSPGTRPANNAAGDSTWYTPTFLDATHMTLDRAYAGTSGCTGTSGLNKGWAIYDTAIANPSYIGWGAQPFMEGLMASGLAMASLATKCTSAGVPTNCDNPTSALLSTYTSDAAQWIANVGYDASTGGVYQGASFVNCTPPSGNVLCNAGNLPWGERVIAQESSGGQSWAYRLSGTTSIKNNIDAQFSAAWSNTNGIVDYNPPAGAYTNSPGATASFKYYGLMGGIDAQPSYQAVRLCSGMAFPCLSPVASVMSRTIYVNYSPSDVAGAAFLHITVTQPDGATTTTACSSSPCSVTGDARQGQDHLIQATYFTSGGVRLAQTAVDLLTVQ